MYMKNVLNLMLFDFVQPSFFVIRIKGALHEVYNWYLQVNEGDEKLS